MSRTRMTTLAFFTFEIFPLLVFEFDFLSLLCNMEYFDDAWYKCRTGRDDVLRTRMTTLAGLGDICFFF